MVAPPLPARPGGGPGWRPGAGWPGGGPGWGGLEPAAGRGVGQGEQQAAGGKSPSARRLASSSPAATA